MFKVSYFMEVLPIIASKVNVTFELTIAATIFALIVEEMCQYVLRMILHGKQCCLLPSKNRKRR